MRKTAFREVKDEDVYANYQDYLKTARECVRTLTAGKNVKIIEEKSVIKSAVIPNIESAVFLIAVKIPSDKDHAYILPISVRKGVAEEPKTVICKRINSPETVEITIGTFLRKLDATTQSEKSFWFNPFSGLFKLIKKAQDQPEEKKQSPPVPTLLREYHKSPKAPLEYEEKPTGEKVPFAMEDKILNNVLAAITEMLVKIEEIERQHKSTLEELMKRKREIEEQLRTEKSKVLEEQKAYIDGALKLAEQLADEMKMVRNRVYLIESGATRALAAVRTYKDVPTTMPVQTVKSLIQEVGSRFKTGSKLIKELEKQIDQWIEQNTKITERLEIVHPIPKLWETTPKKSSRTVISELSNALIKELDEAIETLNKALKLLGQTELPIPVAEAKPIEPFLRPAPALARLEKSRIAQRQAERTIRIPQTITIVDDETKSEDSSEDLVVLENEVEDELIKGKEDEDLEVLEDEVEDENLDVSENEIEDEKTEKDEDEPEEDIELDEAGEDKVVEEDEAELSVEEHSFVIGDKVRVKSGDHEGEIGTIEGFSAADNSKAMVKVSDEKSFYADVGDLELVEKESTITKEHTELLEVE
jgi:hypothetical protein